MGLRRQPLPHGRERERVMGVSLQGEEGNVGKYFFASTCPKCLGSLQRTAAMGEEEMLSLVSAGELELRGRVEVLECPLGSAMGFIISHPQPSLYRVAYT